jgi:NAD-dependent dihydropyrimidine dehydrogenase PreA subunit
MGIFIKVEINLEKCFGVAECGQCIQRCPVTIFEKQSDSPAIIEDNEDECTLCDVCLDACDPNAIKILKLYET